MTHQLDPVVFRLHIRSTLQLFDLWSAAAEELLLGTAAQESHLGYYRMQIKGPARGVYQMEPFTERDIWGRYLVYHRQIADMIRLNCGVTGPDEQALECHLLYQTVMARLHYLRVKPALPDAWNLPSQASYWKIHYNTFEGRGNPEEYIKNYKRYVLGINNHREVES